MCPRGRAGRRGGRRSSKKIAKTHSSALACSLLFVSPCTPRSPRCSRRSSTPRLPQIDVFECQVGAARRWPPLSLPFPSETQTPQPGNWRLHGKKVLRGVVEAQRKRNTEVNSLTSPVVAGAPSHDALSCDPPPPSEERHETRYYDGKH